MAVTRTSIERKKHSKPPSSSLLRAKRKSLRKVGKLFSREKMAVVRFQEGFSDGYRKGLQTGLESYPVPFEGTSIVIPTFNQLDLLKLCINSIIEHTNTPYEIIVVDNASVDGTAHYLQNLGGQVRYRVLDNNRGFAGAINTGLMMTKGRTIVLLNNDTIVTVNWLENLLVCLHSDGEIGMVGPVTNYISGEQRVNVPYEDVVDMPRFALQNNRSDPTRWCRIDRLTGFCLLFRRELFEGIGYFDEGFEMGNFEDDDYNIRVRLLGKSLVIAQDSFIHHFGSVSMKALGDRFVEVNARNELYYMEKWHKPNELIHQSLRHPELDQGGLAHTASYYPEHIVVQAMGANLYWIEQGTRRLLVGSISFPATRISQIDLRRWPLGEPISAEEVERRWHGQGDDGLDVGIVTLPDGSPYHVERDKVRRIITSTAMQAWNLHLKPVKAIEQKELINWTQGLPIIAPPLLRQML